MNEKVLRDTVLVIDDDPDCRGLVALLGQLSNVPVLQAEDCSSALKILERQHHKIKMILLDYFMPGMDPFKCARAILTKAGRSITVVLLTASVDAGMKAGELNINRWIAKPFESSVLRSLMTDGVSALERDL